MYKDNSCRSSPQPPPTTHVAEEAEDGPAASVEPEVQTERHFYDEKGEEDAFSGLSESNSEPEYEVYSRPSTTSSTSSTSGSLVFRSNREIRYRKPSYINSDVRLLRKIGYIASRVRILAKYYEDFKLVNPYSPTKQKQQLQDILEKHSIIDPNKEIEKTEAVKGSSSTTSSKTNSYQQLPTESSVEEDSITTVRKRSSSSTSLSASIFLLEDLLIQFYEDNHNKLTLIKRRRTRTNSRGSNSIHLNSKANKLSTNHLIIMSGKTASSSVERLLQSTSTEHEGQQFGVKENCFVKTASVATTFFNPNIKQSSQQQQLLNPRSSIFLQPTIPGDDSSRRRRASDCSAQFGTPLPNQIQVNFKNNNCNKFPYHRGSCGGTADPFLGTNAIGNRSTTILSKSCSNVGGSLLNEATKLPLHNVGSAKKNISASPTPGGETGGVVGGATSGFNSPSAPASSFTANGNNEYSVIQLNNTIIQCHFNDEDFRTLVKELKRKVEYTERMNWLCLSKRPLVPAHRKSSLPKHQEVKKRFLEICNTAFSDEVKAALRLPAFDSYEWSDADVIHLMQTMFIELGFMEKFNIPSETLREWLYEVYKHYNEVPFHNFRHCFCVAQMMYAITRQANLLQRLGDLECLILLVSCICHDLDHPGYNNIYQINARTELALRYNDISPLENHHCSIAFRLLEHPECNIFKNFNRESFNQIREGIIRCILATDMARHNEILTQFKEITPVFDYNNRAHINLLCMVLIKVADISNEARPMDVAEPWLDRLLQEFFAQSAAEKSEGLPVTPFMDPDKVSKPGSQVRFIGLVLLPLFEALGDLIPDIIELIIIPVRVALDYYKRLNEAQNKSRKSVADSINSENTSGTSEYIAGNVISSTGNSSGTTTATNASGSISPQMPRSQSGMSMKSRRSIPSQKSTSRTSVDEPQGLPAELHDLPEGSESGDSETATEVDVAEKTSKFKVDTEGNTNNRSKSSHPTSRKSSREKRPSMIGEICSSGGGQRMRSSYGNIHGYNSNRSHFGSNRAVSLDQYSTNNRRLSDGLQQVISDSNVFYSRHNRGIIANHQPLGKQMTEQEVPILDKHIVTQGTTIAGNMTSSTGFTTTSSLQPQQQQYQTFSCSTANNGNISPSQTSKAFTTDVSTITNTASGALNATTTSKTSWKARLKQFSDYFSFSFDKNSKRIGSTRSSPCSLRNNNASILEHSNIPVSGSVIDTINAKQGICCTISNSYQSPVALQKLSQNQDVLNAPGRSRAYSLDVPCTRINPRYSASSSGCGGDSRKSSRLGGIGGIAGDENNSNNTLHSSSGGGSEMATCLPPPICIGSVDANDTIVFVTGVPKGVPLVNLADTDHTSLSIDFGSSSEPPKI